MISNSWPNVAIRSICTFIGGGTPSKRESSFWNGDIPWASIKDIKGQYLEKTKDSITEIGFKSSASNIVEPGEIILATRINPGRPILAKIRAAINQDLKIVKPKIPIVAKFLYYTFKNLEPKVLKVSSGTTVLGVSLNNLNELAVPLAPLPEQRAIVAKIEQLFSELDNGIANLKAAKDKLEIYRQAVLKKAFEGELTKEWRKNQNGKKTIKTNKSDYNIAAEPSAKYNVLQSQAKHQENKDLPKGWKWVKLGNVGDVSGGLTKNSGRNKLQKRIPYLRVANVYADRLDLSEIKTIGILDKELARVLLEPNDLLVVEGNGSPNQIGRVALWNGTIDPCVHQNHLIKVRLHENCFPKFALHWLLSPVGRANIKNVASSTSGLYTLNLSKVKSLILPFCSEEEQSQIVNEIESRLSVCDNILANIEEGLEKSEALRQSILKKAFEGRLLSEAEVEACRKEPDWEPAEKLLERINQSRKSA